MPHLPTLITRPVRVVARRFGYALLPAADVEPTSPSANSAPDWRAPGKVALGWDTPPDIFQQQGAWVETLRTLYHDTSAWPASISPEGGSLLYWLIRNIRPTVVIETGTCLGASTIWMAAALEANERQFHAPSSRSTPGEPAPAPTAAGSEPRSHGVVHTFDDFGVPVDRRLAASPLFKDRFETVPARLAQAGLAHRVRFHRGDSKAEIPRQHGALRSLGGVDFAFIDGDHSVHGAVGDLLAVEPVLRIGGYVLLHDVFPEVCAQPGPRYLLDNLARVAGGQYVYCDIFTSPLNYGVALLRRIG